MAGSKVVAFKTSKAEYHEYDIGFSRLSALGFDNLIELCKLESLSHSVNYANDGGIVTVTIKGHTV